MQDLRQANFMVYELALTRYESGRRRLYAYQVRMRRDRADNWLSLLWIAFHVLPPRLFEGGAKSVAFYFFFHFRFFFKENYIIKKRISSPSSVRHQRRLPHRPHTAHRLHPQGAGAFISDQHLS